MCGKTKLFFISIGRCLRSTSWQWWCCQWLWYWRWSSWSRKQVSAFHHQRKLFVIWESECFIWFYLFIREENLLKISRRVKEYKVEILNPPREGKKLLVLDVDYTLFGKSAKTVLHLLLPTTTFFLSFVYFAVVIWNI